MRAYSKEPYVTDKVRAAILSTVHRECYRQHILLVTTLSVVPINIASEKEPWRLTVSSIIIYLV